MLLLENPVQNYAWGSRTRLAELLGRPPAREPEAELWIGAHPKAPSGLSDGRSLLEVIQADPTGMLGARVEERFGARLPFLLKVLAVEAPLSLQAHPTLEQARAGFAREEAAGIPRNAPERTYKDDNHKPELLCALSRFEALSGFRSPAQSAELFEQLGLGELDFVRQLRSPGPEPLRAAFSQLMSVSGAVRSELLQAVLGRCEQACAAPGPFRSSIVWASRLGRAYPGDVGAVASLLLHHFTLQPLEALYLEAGRLHAYLEGTGVEIMASSDNVLRGGLTPKHVDVPELLRVLTFDSTPVERAPARRLNEWEMSYETPAREFRLSRIDLRSGESLAASVDGPELLLCVEGQAHVQLMTPAERHEPPLPESPPRALRRGHACFLPASAGGYRLAGQCRCFRARVGC